MSQKGFVPLIIIVIATLVIGAGVGGFLVLREKKLPSAQDSVSPSAPLTLELSSPEAPTPPPSVAPKPPLQKIPSELSKPQPPSISQPASTPQMAPVTQTPVQPSPIESQGCTGKGPITFTSPPRKLTDIEFIEPLGKLNAYSGHITPTDHGYYIPPNWNPQDNPAEFRDIMAPADGVITTVQLVGNRAGDYRLIIHHTCTFYTIYIHLKELSPRIANTVGTFTSMTKSTKIPVTAGEVIGRATTFDFSVHDDDVILKGFIAPPQRYFPETWKIHTVDMFAYFAEPIKSQLLEKNIRVAEPRTGRIDYDIDGRLIGNWFQENTNGYEGLESNRNQGRYWASHLAFALNHIDPSFMIISIGDFNGTSKDFAVKGNSPDPATVGVTSGLIKYELKDYEYITEKGSSWNRTSSTKISKAVEAPDVEGVVLVQMIENRKIKFEAFPGKTAGEITGFTSAAKIYER